MLAKISFICAIYVSIECFIAFYKMDRGDRLCRLAKYVTSLISSVIVIYWFFRAPNEITISVFVMMLAITLFVWPVMIYRFRGDYRNRIGDK